MVDVAADSHFQRSGECLENALNLVMLVSALGLDVKVHLGSVAKALEEMKEHFSGYIADTLATELGIPYQPRTPTKVKSHTGQTVVHRKAIAIALDAALLAKGLSKAFAEGERGVFYRMVLIYMQVSPYVNLQVGLAVPANLLQHVVEETETRRDVAMAFTVERERYLDVGLFGGASDLCMPLSGKQQFGNTLPGDAFIAKNEGFASEIDSQLAVCFTVADDVAAGKVVGIVVNVFLEHADAWFAVGVVVLGEMAVDMNGVEVDAFAVERVENEILHWPVRILGERWSAQSVLVAYHYQLEIEMLADKGQVVNYAFGETEFFESIYLLIGRFFDYRAVAVDE